MKRNVKPPPPWFRVRCAACICLTIGIWVGVFQAASDGKPERRGAAITAKGVHDTESGSRPGRPNERPAIVIDAGHGGKDPGKVAGDQQEKKWTLELSLTLAEELRARGFPVELTRSDDSTLTLDERSAISNQEPRSAFISIHFNSGKPAASGIEVFYAWPKNPGTMLRLDTEHQAPVGMIIRDDRGRLLAEALQVAACDATGARNRGVRNDPSKAVLNRTLCPAVLIECGFLTNVSDLKNIQSETWRRKLAARLAETLEKWLQAAGHEGYGITFEPSAENPAETGVLHTSTVSTP